MNFYIRSIVVPVLVLASLTTCRSKVAVPSDSNLDSSPFSTAIAPFSPIWQGRGDVTVDIGNKTAFEAKMKLIDQAQRSLRIGYFIFGSDLSTSHFVSKVMAKAAQGVDVRIIIDGMTAMKNRDYFQMMIRKSQEEVTKQRAAGGIVTAKPIEVAYFRPLQNEIFEDLESMGFKDRKALEEAAAGIKPEKLAGLLKQNELIKKNPALALIMGFMAPVPGNRMALGEVARAGLAKKSFPMTIDGFLTQLTGEESGLQEISFRKVAWTRLMKRFHHKLIIVDDNAFMGGGRNMEDHYHVEDDFPPHEFSEDQLLFMDADVVVSSDALARRAAETFDQYWSCVADFKTCRPRIRMEREVPDGAKSYETHFSTVKANEQKYLKEISEYRQDPSRAVHMGQFSSKGAMVSYVENRMFVTRTSMVDRVDEGLTEHPLFPEEPAQYYTVWESMVAHAKPGDEVIMHNAYVLLPSNLVFAVKQAVEAGVKMLFVTNSNDSSNHSVVNTVAKAQYAALLEFGQKVQREKNLPTNPIRFFLYRTQHTLHTKITVAGDMIIVGSGNADPRSKALDTQNGVLIGPSSGGQSIAADYRAWMMRMLSKKNTAGNPILTELSAEVAMEEVRQMETLQPGARSDLYVDAFAAKLTRIGLGLDPLNQDEPARIGALGLLNAMFLNL